MDSLTDIFHYGVVEQRDTDPLRLGRCKVRVIGIHTEDIEELPVDDLPWAYPLGIGLSASMSGIGNAPVGPVEGSIVIVFFRDVYKQHPIILGTLGGIPEEFDDYKTMLVNSQSQLTDTKSTGGTGGDTSGPSGGTFQQDESDPAKNINQPGAMTISKSGINWMKDNEGLASLDPKGIKTGNTRSKLSPETRLYAYKDQGGTPTIGWGNTTYADGTKVKLGDSITKAEADDLFDSIHQEHVDGINKNLKVPVTQSMFDSLVDMSYNMGNRGLTSSKMWSALNSGRYEEAAALIPSTRATVKGKPNSGLSNRREKQKAVFLKDGIPSKDNSKILPDPTAPDDSRDSGGSSDKTDDPAVRDKQGKEGATSGGNGGDNGDEDFQEGDYFQTIKDVRKDKVTKGFRDPYNQYPRQEYLNEPDTHRLARHEKIDRTIVAKKEAARVLGVKLPFGDKKWDQPKIPYNALYPFNHTFVSESGHVQEFDDTHANERVHTYHNSGTFEEIDVNGTRVNRIVGDGYEIFERNGRVLVKGECDLTVRGDINIRVECDANIQVLGNAKTEITGNSTTSVKGDWFLKAKNIRVEAYDGDIDVTAPNGSYAEEAKMIYMNSGVAVPTGIDTPTEESPGRPEFPTLEVPNRNHEWNGNYESEEEGDSTEFIQAMKKSGNFKPGDTDPQPKDPEGNDPTEEPPKKEPPKDKDVPACGDNHKYPIGKGPYSAGTRLNDNWTLGQLCTGRSGIPSGTNYGKSSKEIVQNLQSLADNVLDPIKRKYPNLVITNSWRSQAVNNSLAGSSKTSDHLSGQAVDLQFSGFNRKQTYEAAIEIQKLLPDYHQILLEYSGNSMWIHVSYKSKCAGGGNKRQIMTIDVMNRANNANGKFVLYGGEK